MRKGRIPDDWFGAQIAQTDRTDGDIDTLSGRIAQIRPGHSWQIAPIGWRIPSIGRELRARWKDKLSDALHERLTERFVDRRTSVLMRRLRENTMLNTEIGKTGEVIVEGHVIGRLDGFTFLPDAAEAGSDAKALQATALKALAGEIDARAEKLVNAPDDQFVLGVRWHHALDRRCGGLLVAADDVLHPRHPHHRRRAPHRRAARCGAGPARSVAEDAYREAARAAVRSRRRPKTSPVSRAASPSSSSKRSACSSVQKIADRDEGSRSAVARVVAQIRRAFRRLSYLSSRPAEAGRRGRCVAFVALKQDNVDLSALTGAQHLAGVGPHLVPGRQG